MIERIINDKVDTALQVAFNISGVVGAAMSGTSDRGGEYADVVAPATPDVIAAGELIGRAVHIEDPTSI